jgi:hypothetical protein
MTRQFSLFLLLISFRPFSFQFSSVHQLNDLVMVCKHIVWCVAVDDDEAWKRNVYEYANRPRGKRELITGECRLMAYRFNCILVSPLNSL